MIWYKLLQSFNDPNILISWKYHGSEAITLSEVYIIIVVLLGGTPECPYTVKDSMYLVLD